MKFWKHGMAVYYMKLTFIFYQFNTKYSFIFSRTGFYSIPRSYLRLRIVLSQYTLPNPRSFAAMGSIVSKSPGVAAFCMGVVGPPYMLLKFGAF